jgi:hypothetical protein
MYRLLFQHHRHRHNPGLNCLIYRGCRNQSPASKRSCTQVPLLEILEKCLSKDQLQALQSGPHTLTRVEQLPASAVAAGAEGGAMAAAAAGVGAAAGSASSSAATVSVKVCGVWRCAPCHQPSKLNNMGIIGNKGHGLARVGSPVYMMQGRNTHCIHVT